MDTPLIEDQIKAFGRQAGALVVGIASVEDIARYAPKGHRPTDLMRGCRSIVVVGTGMTSNGTWRSENARAHASIAYNRATNIVLAQHIVSHIEREHEYAAMLCPPGSAGGRHPYISLKLLGEMAGLGTRSMAANIVLNETYGLLYFGAALTTMPLKADGPLDKPVCPHPSCAKLWKRKGLLPCLDACPTCLSGELEGKIIKWMEYDQTRCLPRAQTTAMAAFQKLLFEAMNETDPQKRKMILFGQHFSRAVATLGYSAELVGQCFECVRKCPVGIAYRSRVK
jgi:ferredoxin